jgi:hypothetical protein
LLGAIVDPAGEFGVRLHSLHHEPAGSHNEPPMNYPWPAMTPTLTQESARVYRRLRRLSRMPSGSQAASLPHGYFSEKAR